jgi:uncharacterized membrane protein
MATLVAIGYPDEVTAEAARQTVASLEEEDLIIQADQVAAIRRDTDGKYHITTTHEGPSSGGVIKTSLSEEDTQKLQEALTPPETVGAAS